MANILFYSPFNQRSRDTESLMIAFRNQGHWVCSLSQYEGLLIHDFLEARGIETHSFIVDETSAWWRHWKHFKFLVKFCWTKRIDIIYSHLEAPNFVATLAQFFVPAKVVVCRHHADQYKRLLLNKNWSYRVTYKLARQIIAFSDSTRDIMIKEEGVPPRRILRINLAYDFSLYTPVRAEQLEVLKSKYKAEVLLITVGSFLPLKRPEMSIHVTKSLRNKGIDAKLVLLGRGELEPSLRSLTETLGLTDCVFFAGYVDNVLEHLTASSFVLHPSISEASCVSIKEAGLAERPVIVCRDVGDFQEYITHSENGFLVDENNYVVEASEIIQQYRMDPAKLLRMGEKLKDSVTSHFDIKNILPCYDSINKS